MARGALGTLVLGIEHMHRKRAGSRPETKVGGIRDGESYNRDERDYSDRAPRRTEPEQRGLGYDVRKVVRSVGDQLLGIPPERPNLAG